MSSQYTIYSRKSRFTGKRVSIANQIEFCRRYIQSTYSEDAAAYALVYEEEGGVPGRPLSGPGLSKWCEIPEEIEIAKTIYAKFLQTRFLTKTETYLIQKWI